MAIKSALWGMGGAVALAALFGTSALAGPAYGGPYAQGSHGDPYGGPYGPGAYAQPYEQGGYVEPFHATCAVGQDCRMPVAVLPSPVGHTSPMTIQNHTPYDYFDSIHFQRAPHVSITRIHGLLPNAGLDDAPTAFYGQCHPQSTLYCRQDQGVPIDVTLNSPAPQPIHVPVHPPQIYAPQVYAPQTYASLVHAPQVYMPQPHTPVVTERVVAIGGGYDPSKFAPRVYGDPYTITPGIAHVPTSIVDRDPARAQALLDTRQPRPNPWTPGGITPALAGAPIGPLPAPRLALPTPHFSGPVMTGPSIGHRLAPTMGSGVSVTGSIPTGFPGAAGAPVLQPDGSYASTVGADGTYWEKVSAPTVVGGLNAAEVICKRQLPTQRAHPVIGLAHPVVEPSCDLPPALIGYESRPRGRY